MAKARRETDRLNVAISGVTAAASIIKTCAAELPDSDAKRQIIAATKQVDWSADIALDCMRIIKNAADNI